MTAEPRSWTGTVDRAPSKEPMMVHATETRTTGSESTLILPHYRLSSSYCGPQDSRLSAGFFFFFLLYNTVLVLPYMDMNPPQVYMSSQP